MTTEQSPINPAATPSISRRNLVKAAAIGGAAVAGLGIAGCRKERTASSLVAHYHAGELPMDPEDKAWSKHGRFTVPLVIQAMTLPHVAGLSIPELRVRALHNKERIAFLVDWDDQQADAVDAMARFRDAVAVMLPLSSDAAVAVTMGSKDQPTHIVQWRASWQADVDLGRRTVQDAFPNMFHDAPHEETMGQEAARQFYPALVVGNPLAARERTVPVEELTAAGFGSLTSHAEQSATGKGVFQETGWKVVLSWPLQGGPDKSNLSPGGSTSVSFAAWNGTAGDRGARKQWANWTPLAIEAAS